MIIGVVSGKGGVGSTTVAINLATAITRLGKDILLVDGNVRNPHVGLYLGNPPHDHTVRSVIRDQDVSQALLVHSSGLHLITGDISEYRDLTAWDIDRLGQVLRSMDVPILLDFPAGMQKDMMKLVDGVIIVTTPDLAAVTDAYKVRKLCVSLQKPILGVVVNRMSIHAMMTIDSIRSMLEENILGILPDEYAVARSVTMRHPVVYSHPHTRISKAFYEIARHLIGK